MMNKITFPLKPRMQGPQVADLQDALKLMLERDSISPGNPRARAALLDKLPSEHQTQTYGSATNKIVTVFQEEQQLRPDGIVGQQTADAINALLKEWGVLSETTEPEAIKYQVQGQIQQADATPLAGALVRAFDKDLRHEQLLGETSSDRQGRYTITYTQAQFRRAEKQSADLIVRVVGPDGSVPVSSDVIFNAQPLEVIDLEVPAPPPPPEYQQLCAELSPLLEGVSFSELTEEDVVFLNGETGIEYLLINFLISATKQASLTKLGINIHYGMLREGLSSELSLLLKQERDVLRLALETAIANNRIAPLSSAELKEVLDRMEELK
jgi:hypothetical protein